MSKIVLFQTIQSSISTECSSVCPIDRILLGATTLGQSGPGSGPEGVLCIPQNSSITGTSPSDCLVSYPGHSLGGVLPPQQRNSRCILQPQPNKQTKIVGFKILLRFFCFLVFWFKFFCVAGYFLARRQNSFGRILRGQSIFYVCKYNHRFGFIV